MVGPTTRRGFWAAAHAGASAEVLKLKGTLITYAGPEAPNNAEQQGKVVAQALAEKPDLLIIAPVNQPALDDALAQAAKAGVPVVVAGMEPRAESKPRAVVAPDNAAIGAAAAAHIAKLLEKDEEVLIVHAPEADDAELIETSFLSAAKGSNIKVVDPGLAGADAADRGKLDSFFQSSSILVVFAPSPTVAQSVRDVLRVGSRLDRARIVAVTSGDDAVQALATGELEAIVAVDPVDLGRLAARAALDCLSGTPVAQIPRPRFVVVTRKNMQDPGIKEVVMPETTSALSP